MKMLQRLVLFSVLILCWLFIVAAGMSILEDLGVISIGG